ncbi:hypothetical protein [Nitrincola iocasae]|uniref:hypothetical protein n=1 Tax=Nitrincola iocasae TaxID=2614693 RepID=UPI00177AAB3E|nr:hypothetical protein [Nitrincola iocasae]
MSSVPPVYRLEHKPVGVGCHVCALLSSGIYWVCWDCALQGWCLAEIEPCWGGCRFGVTRFRRSGRSTAALTAMDGGNAENAGAFFGLDARRSLQSDTTTPPKHCAKFKVTSSPPKLCAKLNDFTTLLKIDWETDWDL